MTVFIGALQFINIFFGAILVGSLAFEFVVVVPAFKRLPPDMGARVHKVVLGVLPDYLLPPSAAISAVALALLLIFHSHLRSQQTVIYVLGLIFALALGISTFAISRPVNKRINSWDLATESHPEYPATLLSFQRIHAFRTTVGLIALALFILGAIAH